MPSLSLKGLMSFVVVAAVAAAVAVPPALAVDGTVVVSVKRCEALDKNADTIFGTQQDPYPRIVFPGGPPVDGPILNGKDEAEWAPSGFTLSRLTPITERTMNVQVALYDDDDTSDDDPFDINPAAPISIDLTFDTCTLRWTAPGIAGEQGPGVIPVVGVGTNPASIEFEVTTGDRRPFTVNDVAIAGASPVQAVFDPSRIIAGKPLAFRVDLVSTYGADVTAPVTVTLKDDSTGGERMETRTLTVGPAGTTAFFFDGTGAEPAYLPGRNAANPFLEYKVFVDLPESAPPGTDPKFVGCYSANNRIDGQRRPIVATQDPYVVYQRWDWSSSVGLIATPAWIPEAELNAFRDHEESFRLATWPLAALNPANRARAEVGQTEAARYVGPVGPPWVVSTLARAGAAASVAGIDRLVLVTRQGWFQENDLAGADIPDGAIGISLGEFGRHAVIAEDGFFGVGVHELGHTFELSRHSCSTGGLAESLLNVGCRDEYSHSAADGRSYVGLGLDVVGDVYPSGYTSAWATVVCPAMVPGTREVCAASFMDSSPLAVFQNWIDNLATISLTSDLKTPGDPELINLTGWVHVAGGLAGGGTPIVFDGGLLFAYHFDGAPDLPKPPLSGFTAGSGPFAGGGPFAVRLNTGQGTYTYRFTPEFRVEGTDIEYAYFSFNVPWVGNVHQIELYTPTNVAEIDCEIPPCATSDDTLVFARARTNLNPAVTTIRAGIDTAPTLAGPQPEPPTIAPGHDLVLAWDPTDGDSPELRSAIVIDKAPGSGGPQGWLPVDIEIAGNTLRVPHTRLKQSPGEYVARVVVSDGVNSVTYTSPQKVFTICNQTNGGVEICNGLDDDCNGQVDETPLINNQPWLTVDDAGLSWTPRCGAAGYDVAYGKISALRIFGDFRDYGCLANTQPGTILPFIDTPGVGDGFWFQVRVAHETWNDGTEATSRDLSLLACP